MMQGFVTVAVPFRRENAAPVNAELEKLGNLARDPLKTLLDSAAFVHFMSMTVVCEEGDSVAWLVLEASVDGHPRAGLARIANELGAELMPALRATGEQLPAETGLAAHLEKYRYDVGAGWYKTLGLVFSGTPEMSVERIRREATLAARIRERLEAKDTLPMSALQRLRFARDMAYADAELKAGLLAERVPPADTPEPFDAWAILASLICLLWPLVLLPVLCVLAGAFAAAVVVLVTELIAVLLLLGAAYAMLRVLEEIDPPEDREPPVSAVAELMSRENQAAQNHLAGVSVIKAGRVRRLALRLVLWFIGEFGRTLYPAGTLAGIGTIHFARWIVLPGTDKLLFFSNYDGSWESYLEDFIARAHGGLSAIWSNTRDFPRTRSLVIGGASDGERFKRWARRQQRPARFWYSAYPHLTTQRIRINARICHGLAAARTDADAVRWLALMQYRAPATVEAHEVPALAFGGLKPLGYARCLVLELPGDPRECGQWLAATRARIQYGEERPGPEAVVLGLTHTGLCKLGLEEALGSFPAAFHQGMAAPGRAAALGDVGADRPAAWWWGGPATPADAVLIAYAESEDRLEDLCRQLQSDFREGQKLVYQLALAPLPPKDLDNDPARRLKEPFGFVDGVSQPILRGSRKWVTQRNPIHVVEPGEMILGYADNLGYVAPLPSHNGIDLGTNGTFLVIRQLEQDTKAFGEFLAEQAILLNGDPRVPSPAGLAPATLEHWIAAKMVGRWRDGSSLVRHPARPGIDSQAAKYPDNDFLFGAEDPDGLCCPLGAHIRRANPRESFEPGSRMQLGITNRHRIFRVGRPYAPQDQPQGRLDKPGLLFMCVNADIEGQFEFLQQTWILGANFHDLSDEIDPAVGYRPGRPDGERFTIPTEKGPIRLKGLRDFVTLRGGGYFFLPSRRALDYLRNSALGRAPPQDAPGY